MRAGSLQQCTVLEQCLSISNPILDLLRVIGRPITLFETCPKRPRLYFGSAGHVSGRRVLGGTRYTTLRNKREWHREVWNAPGSLYIVIIWLKNRKDTKTYEGLLFGGIESERIRTTRDCCNTRKRRWISLAGRRRLSRTFKRRRFGY